MSLALETSVRTPITAAPEAFMLASAFASASASTSQDDFHGLSRTALGQGQPDAAGRAGDDRDLALEIVHGRSSVVLPCLCQASHTKGLHLSSGPPRRRSRAQQQR